MSTTTKRTLRARVIAFIWSNPACLSAWIDGAITGALVTAVAVALLGGAT